MSYGEFPSSEGQPQQPAQPPAKRGGSGCLILLIIGGVGLFLLSRAAPRGGQPANPPADRGVQQQPADGGQGSSRSGETDSSSSGSIFDIGSSKDSDSSRQQDRPQNGSTGTAKKTTKGDWSVEEVKTKSSADSNLKIQSNPRSVQPENKKTQKGDWSIEEADAGSSTKVEQNNSLKLSNPAEKKQTKQGNWELDTE